MTSEKDCPCKYIFQRPLSLHGGSFLFQALELFKSENFLFWKSEIAENYNNTSFFRAFQEYPRIKITQTNEKPKPPTNSYFSEQTLHIWYHGLLLTRDLSGWASQPRVWFVNTYAVSDISSHCHAEPHRYLTGKLKAANLYCPIQHTHTHTKKPKPTPNLSCCSFPNLRLSNASKWNGYTLKFSRDAGTAAQWQSLWATVQCPHLPEDTLVFYPKRELCHLKWRLQKVCQQG